MKEMLARVNWTTTIAVTLIGLVFYAFLVKVLGFRLEIVLIGAILGSILFYVILMLTADEDPDEPQE